MRTLALTSIFFAAACGGAALDDSSADDLTYGEPMHWVSMASDAATQYAANPHLMHVDGKAGAKSMAWTFTFRGDLGRWATVASDGKSATVIQHWTMIETPLGVSAIDPATVKVTVTRLKGIAAKAGCASMKSIELSQPLTMQTPNPHWMVDSGAKEVFVDAVTGAVMP